MNELVQVGKRTYYIDCTSKMGICLYGSGNACLIDSGMGDGHGRLALEIIKERGWKLGMIINTHSHADHTGGNRLIQEATGCPAYAAGADAAIIKNSLLNTSLLFGGNPPEFLKNRLLYSSPSDVKELADSVLPPGVTATRLDGHSFAMSGIRSPDGVWFLADSLSSNSMLEKYHIPFVRDVAKHLETLSAVKSLEGRLFIPSHVKPLDETGELADANRRKILEIAEKILDILVTPSCFEDLLKSLFDSYGLTMEINQYMLAGSTVRSFLSYLADCDKITHIASENRLLWKTAR
jgi:glyoxylase-like metal-dependent hydrolase (beta-lactamase superfamily II)